MARARAGAERTTRTLLLLTILAIVGTLGGCGRYGRPVRPTAAVPSFAFEEVASTAGRMALPARP
jgi:hypothetical protein